MRPAHRMLSPNGDGAKICSILSVEKTETGLSDDIGNRNLHWFRAIKHDDRRELMRRAKDTRYTRLMQLAAQANLGAPDAYQAIWCSPTPRNHLISYGPKSRRLHRSQPTNLRSSLPRLT